MRQAGASRAPALAGARRLVAFRSIEVPTRQSFEQEPRWAHARPRRSSTIPLLEAGTGAQEVVGCFPASDAALVAPEIRATKRALLVSLALQLSLTAPVTAAPPFSAPSLSFDTGSAPNSLAIADLNGDGRPDLAVTNSGGYALSLLFGVGDGTFWPKVDISTANRPNFVTIADVDADGRPDLVVSNPPSISVMLGNGDGTFRAGRDIANLAGALAVADLDNDGRLDLAVAHDWISVLLGNGDGTFGSRADFPAMSATSLAVADLNDDGRPDLVAANSSADPEDVPPWTHSISVLLGNGDGTFGPYAGFGVGYRCGSLAIGELNGDGRPDVVVTNSYDRNTTGSVLFGNGDGTFGYQGDFATGVGPFGVVIADLNGDGRQDFAVTNRGGDPDAVSNSVSVFLGDGRGNIRAAGEFNVRENPMAMGVADFDADGHPDLAVTNLGSQSVSVLLGNGDGTFGTPAIRTAGFPQSVAIADFDTDGRPDLAVANNGPQPSYTGWVSMRFGNGDGTFRAGGNFALGTGSGSIAAADLNGDGKPDLAVTNAGTYPNWIGHVSVMLGNGDGTFRARIDYATGMFSCAVAIADLDGNGKPDLAVANTGSMPTYASTVSVLLGIGDGTFSPATNFAAGAQPSSVAVADLNADGRPDLAVANSGWSGIVSVLLGNGDGTFGAGTDFPSATWARSIAIADLNDDGRLDLGLASGACASILLGNGNGTFGVSSQWSTGSDLDASAIVIGDLNTDGRPDLAVTNDDVDGVVSVRLGNGDGTFGPRIVFGAGWFPQSIAIGDLDVDGRPDLAVANTGSQTISILLATGDSPTPIAMSLVSADASPDRVVMRWWGEGAAALGAGVYRRTESSDWERLGDATAEGADLLRYEDRTVTAGARYAYRLGYREGTAELLTDEVWVDMPSGLRLALAGFQPNPAFGVPVVAFTLANDSPASIEVLDLAGRRVLRREVGGLGAGNHVMRLDAGARLAPGAYVMRLRQSGRTLSARGVVVR